MDVLLAAAESLRSAEINEFHRRAGKIQKVHVKRKRGVFKCDKCPSVFGLRHNLLRHERTIHQGRRPFKCDQPACSASFVQRFDLETHRASVHHKRKDHRCLHCNRSFSQRSNLLTHVRISHEAPIDDDPLPSPQSSPQTVTVVSPNHYIAPRPNSPSQNQHQSTSTTTPPSQTTDSSEQQSNE